jgi:hypothetical protein
MRVTAARDAEANLRAVDAGAARAGRLRRDDVMLGDAPHHDSGSGPPAARCSCAGCTEALFSDLAYSEKPGDGEVDPGGDSSRSTGSAFLTGGSALLISRLPAPERQRCWELFLPGAPYRGELPVPQQAHRSERAEFFRDDHRPAKDFALAYFTSPAIAVVLLLQEYSPSIRRCVALWSTAVDEDQSRFPSVAAQARCFPCMPRTSSSTSSLRERHSGAPIGADEPLNRKRAQHGDGGGGRRNSCSTWAGIGAAGLARWKSSAGITTVTGWITRWRCWPT